MCLGAIVNARVRNVVFGVFDNHIRARDAVLAVEYIRQRLRSYVGGVLEDECIDMIGVMQSCLPADKGDRRFAWCSTAMSMEV